MPLEKEELIESLNKFNKDKYLLNYLSQIFKSLSDPTRLKIIYALSKAELCVTDIATYLDMSQSAISHQLSILRNQELVKSKRVGRRSIYSLDDEHVLSLFNQGYEHAYHKKNYK